MSLKLKAGKNYVIIPSPKDAGTTGEFYLSFYFSCELNDIFIELQDKPTDRCKLYFNPNYYRFFYFRRI